MLIVGAALAQAMPASVFAKDGGGEGGGHDDGGHDDGGDDHGGNRGRRGDADQDEALAERERGDIISLKKALSIARREVRGKVIDVNLSLGDGPPRYRIKIRSGQGVIVTIGIEGRTGRIIDGGGY